MSVKRWAYGLVRPVVRPLMGCLRSYFMGPLHNEIGDLRREVAALREMIEQKSVQADQRVIEVTPQALATLALDRER